MAKVGTLSVLHLSSEMDWRGGEQQIVYLIDLLRQWGIHVHVAVKAHSEVERYCLEHGHNFTPMSFSSSVDLGTAFQIRKLCKANHFDLIHAHSSRSHGAAIFSTWFGNRVPVILSRRVDFVPKNNLTSRWKYNHTSIKKVLCVSEAITQIMRGYLHDPDKAITVHSGVDTQRFAHDAKSERLRTELGLDRNVFLVGNTSALEDHKDYPTFLQTISELKGRHVNVHAVIMGKGSLEGGLRNMVDQLGIGDNVTFAGFRKDLPQVLPELDLFLMTSKTEGLGTSVLDSFAAGVPVVATRAGGIPEMVIHGRTGLLTEPGDYKSIADCVERLVKNPIERHALVTGASQHLRNFSKEETARKTLEAYHQILGLGAFNLPTTR